MSWFTKDKVLVPVDFSDLSFSAIDTALELVADPSHLIVVHVLQELSPVEPGEIWAQIDHETRKRHTSGALRERLAKDNHEDVTIEVRIGDAGREVAELAEQQNCDLIVLTSHGRTGLKRLLIGSVAERIIRLAHCPVLVLRS